MLRKRNTLGTVLSKSQKLGVSISGCGFAVQSPTSITMIYSSGAQLVAGHVGQVGKCPWEAMDHFSDPLTWNMGRGCVALLAVLWKYNPLNGFTGGYWLLSHWKGDRESPP